MLSTRLISLGGPLLFGEPPQYSIESVSSHDGSSKLCLKSLSNVTECLIEVTSSETIIRSDTVELKGCNIINRSPSR